MELGVQEIINKLKKLRQKYKTAKDNKNKVETAKGGRGNFLRKWTAFCPQDTMSNLLPLWIPWQKMKITLVSTAAKILFVFNKFSRSRSKYC